MVRGTIVVRPDIAVDGRRVIPPSVTGSLREVVAGRAREIVRERAETRLVTGTILRASPDGIAVLDREGRFHFANERLARWAGASLVDLPGRNVAEFFPEVWESVEEATPRPGLITTRELRLTVAQRSPRWLLLRAYALPLLDEDDEQRIGICLTDITAIKDAEQALRLANERKDQFLSIASHELRNPVGIIHGMAQQLQRLHRGGRLTEARLSEYLDDLASASQRLALLTNDLLDVARLQRGTVTLDVEPTDMPALLKHIGTLDRWPSRVVLTLPKALPLAMIDGKRVHQVISNLVDNALKYSPPSRPVEVVASPSADGILIEIRDEGIGLPPEELKTIFTPFSRAMNAGSVPGLGVGLYVAREVTERLGGHLWADSEGVGHGTTMSLWLPSIGPDEGEQAAER